MPTERITGLVLAGGRARRMGEQDKGLMRFQGRPLVAWAIERLTPQVDDLLISANHRLDEYATLGHSVLADRLPDFAGPLAGIHAGLCANANPLLLTAPCDCPFLPDDLVTRLLAALESSGADLARVRTASGLHPVFSLLRQHLRDHLFEFLEAGGRKVDTWHARLKVATVHFDDEHAFSNINTPEELRALEK